MAHRQTIGLDAGGTLIKAAYHEKGRLHLKHSSYDSIGSFFQWLQLAAPEAVFSVTGGKAAYLEDKLKAVSLRKVDEFAAVTEGVRFLLGPSHPLLEKGFILANIGTGTSIHFISGRESIRLAGSGVGGGTLVGLSSIIAGEKDFHEIDRLAALGDRSLVDLQVKDIYEPSEPPIPGHFTASNFGKGMIQQERRKEDLLAALAGMIAETVVLLAIHNAQIKGVQDIVYVGNAVNGSQFVKGLLKQTTEVFGFSFHELDKGGYSGAIGALLSKE